MFLVARPGTLNHLAELNRGESRVVRQRGRRQALADLLTAQALIGRVTTATVDVPVYEGPGLDQRLLATIPAGQPFQVLNEVDQDLVWLMLPLGTGRAGYTPFLPEAMQVSSSIAVAGVAAPTGPAPGTPAPPSPGFGTLVWRTLTGQSQGLFSCRPDSYFCAGTGAQAYKQGSLPDPGPAGTPPTWFYLAAGAAGLLVVAKLMGAR